MALWAISDLHLSFGVKDKPMNIFGESWTNYEEKIRTNWTNLIKEEDTVILAGDFSWGMYLEETKEDFDFLESLPGRKIMLKGNHDYWWETLTKLNKFKNEHNYESVNFLHNNYYETEEHYICGTRAWEKGAEDLEAEQDEKVYKREKERLERSLKSVGQDKEIIAVTHYNIGNNQEFVEILKKYNVKLCIYGHLHGKIDKEKLDYERDGIRFLCTSCDLINFLPIKISD